LRQHRSAGKPDQQPASEGKGRNPKRHGGAQQKIGQVLQNLPVL
jgi:hypothetical protein